VGPPGTGKSLLARILPGLLPPLEAHAAMEVAAVYSAAGMDLESPETPPFRDPHHSVSMSAMVGGGAHPRPGEISLAHHGVLFLDELPHFKPSVLDSLREPLETGTVGIVRTSWRCAFPARFQLVAAMNPCPAGLVCSPTSCRCRPDQVLRYQARVSGPLLDRIDLHVSVPEVPPSLLLPGAAPAEDGVSSPDDILAARTRQQDRQGSSNALLDGAELTRVCALDRDGERLLERAAGAYHLSARGFHRVLRVARTVADLEGARAVSIEHLAEALGYRAMSWEGGPVAGPRASR
jgi:magnesium chelatase family protein